MQARLEFDSRRGNVQVASYDHDTGVRVVVTLKANFQVDDHDTPSLLVRPDGRLLAFWSAHSGGQMYYRRSVRPEESFLASRPSWPARSASA